MPDRTSSEVAVQQLREAGDSVEKLIEAVKNASFLEDVPSPERQLLRATKLKLKRAVMKERNEQRRKSLFQPTNVNLDKFLGDTESFQKLCEEYEKMKWRIVKMPGGATRKADAYYTLYGLMKQALVGDVDEACPMFSENGNIDFHGRFLWDAWNVTKGMVKGVDEKHLVFTLQRNSPSLLLLLAHADC